MKAMQFLRDKQHLQNELKEEWDRLTDEDIEMLLGGTDRLISALQKRYGYTRKKAQKQIRRFLRRFGYRPRSRWDRMRDQLAGMLPEYLWWTLAFAIAALVLCRYRPANVSNRKPLEWTPPARQPMDQTNRANEAEKPIQTEVR